MATQNSLPKRLNAQYDPALVYLPLLGSHTPSLVQVCKLLRPV